MFVTRFTTVTGLTNRFNKQSRKLRKLAKLRNQRSTKVGAKCRRVRLKADRLDARSVSHNLEAQRAERMAQKLDNFFND